MIGAAWHDELPCQLEPGQLALCLTRLIVSGALSAFGAGSPPRRAAR
jgi:hypothetical protein